MNRCVIISAAPNTNDDFCRSIIQEDDFVVCADGGMDTAQRLNIVPNLTIGDFDSSKAAKKTGKKIITLPTHKDDTDTMSCIKEVIAMGCKNVVILGAIGGRTDHTFANITALAYMSKNGVKGVLMDENTTIAYTDSHYAVNGCKGKTVSVFPFGCAAARVTLEGFLYPLNQYDLLADFPLGISNIAQSDTAVVTVYSGAVIVITNLCDC